MADKDEQMQADGVVQQADHSTDRQSKFTAITTLVLAVCTTLASFKAASYGNDMVIAQSQLANQWAYYQAKSIKETAYQVQKQALEIWLRQSDRPEHYQETVEHFANETARYAQEKREIAEEAKHWEGIKDTAQKFYALYGQALIFLQLGILLSSLASINKTSYFWYIGFICGGIGIFIFLYGLVKSL